MSVFSTLHLSASLLEIVLIVSVAGFYVLATIYAKNRLTAGKDGKRENVSMIDMNADLLYPFISNVILLVFYGVVLYGVTTVI